MTFRSLLAAFAIAAAPAAQAVTINFEGYADPTNFVSFTDQGATFTGLGNTTGFEISTYGTSNWGTGAPKILCPRTAANYCGGDFQVSFASLVNGLSFRFTGDDAVRTLTVQAFNGSSLLGTVNVAGDGNTVSSHLVNLASLGNLNRIVVTGASLDDAGYGYDDFVFNLVQGAVPEPATWAMMILGFGGIGATMRHRRRVAFA